MIALALAAIESVVVDPVLLVRPSLAVAQTTERVRRIDIGYLHLLLLRQNTPRAVPGYLLDDQGHVR